MKTEEQLLRRKIKRWISFFIVALILSGVTAFPIETQLAIAMKHLDVFPLPMQNWLGTIFHAVKTTNDNFPYLAYGTDWLAFAHIVIATAFIGPLTDPVRNIWVIQFGNDRMCNGIAIGAYSRTDKTNSFFLATDRLFFWSNWHSTALYLLQKHQKVRTSAAQ
jgi:hypothetical protein